MISFLKYPNITLKKVFHVVLFAIVNNSKIKKNVGKNGIQRIGILINKETSIMRTESIKYIRDKKNNRIGVMVGIKNQELTGSELINIGWSRCRKSKKSSDFFDKNIGLQIARGRAIAASKKDHQIIPKSIMNDLYDFATKCEYDFRSKGTILDENVIWV